MITNVTFLVGYKKYSTRKRDLAKKLYLSLTSSKYNFKLIDWSTRSIKRYVKGVYSSQNSLSTSKGGKRRGGKAPFM